MSRWAAESEYGFANVVEFKIATGEFLKTVAVEVYATDVQQIDSLLTQKLGDRHTKLSESAETVREAEPTWQDDREEAEGR